MHRFPYAWLSWCISIPLVMGLGWYIAPLFTTPPLEKTTLAPTVTLVQSDTHISLGRGVVVWPHRILTAQHVVSTVGGYEILHHWKNTTVDRVEFGSGDTARCYVDAPLTTRETLVVLPQPGLVVIGSLTGEIQKSDWKWFVTVQTRPWDSGTPVRQSGQLIGVISSYDPLLRRTLVALP